MNFYHALTANLLKINDKCFLLSHKNAFCATKYTMKPSTAKHSILQKGALEDNNMKGLKKTDNSTFKTRVFTNHRHLGRKYAKHERFSQLSTGQQVREKRKKIRQKSFQHNIPLRPNRNGIKPLTTDD